jgi:phosphatidylcholine synthase
MKVRRVLAWSVHLYTAMGIVCGFSALLATLAGQVCETFWWLLLALFIDGTDGILARAIDVKRVVPEYDGRKLDDITDYLNYVFIPVVFAHRFGLVPRGWELVLALPLLASAYGFCCDTAKTSDGYFTGFPSYWNVVVVYLYLLGVRPQAGALLFAYLSLMVFVPIRYLYPTQAPRFRALSLGLSLVWGLMFVWILCSLPEPPMWLVWASTSYPAYYVLVSFYLHLTMPVAVPGTLRPQPDLG